MRQSTLSDAALALLSDVIGGQRLRFFADWAMSDWGRLGSAYWLDRKPIDPDLVLELCQHALIESHGHGLVNFRVTRAGHEFVRQLADAREAP